MTTVFLEGVEIFSRTERRKDTDQSPRYVPDTIPCPSSSQSSPVPSYNFASPCLNDHSLSSGLHDHSLSSSLHDHSLSSSQSLSYCCWWPSQTSGWFWIYYSLLQAASV